MKKLLLTASLFLSLGTLQAQNVYTYYFDGDFKEAGGVGPDLTPVCTGSFVGDTLVDYGNLNRQVYRFDQNCGFEYDDSMHNFIATGSYTIELYFKMDNLASWKRVIDYKLRTTDRGCYVFNGQLNFYNIASSAGAPFTANEYSHYVITRNDTTKDVLLYGDGNNYIQFNDAGGDAVYSANKKLRFFQDDLVVANEASSGSIAILRIYNYAMDSTMVSDVYDDLSGTLAVNNTVKGELAAEAYPNPVSDVLRIALPDNEAYQYSVLSFTGSVVKSGTISNASNGIDVQNMPAGMYVLKLASKEGISGNLKFVKQ
ncbi:MAG: T9SS type A sorting domain-containing protein [Flavipsychrobacter sp.]|nr:T9SS type A sorting domain-containing protein [Flavipsychrobacter sp.]